ncbi:MAG: hypothetical protein EPO40_08150 [Myxococcaceae bacterium]|nr:MAG: hypothetical protein EPO40_08150 [Myxococcaceae bacterium]
MPPRNCMSFTVPPGLAPERRSLHHRPLCRTALALALALSPAASLACPQCASGPAERDAAPAALAALALAPIVAMAAGALWLVRSAHRRAVVE